MDEEDAGAILSDLEKLNNTGTSRHDDSFDFDDIVDYDNSEEHHGIVNVDASAALKALEAARLDQDISLMQPNLQEEYEIKPDDDLINVKPSTSSQQVFQPPTMPQNVFAVPISSFNNTLDEESQTFDVMETEPDEEEPEFITAEELDDESDIPVSFHNALLLNENYQMELKWMIKMLEEALAENRSKQDSLRDEIDTLEQGKPIRKHLAQNAIISRNPVTVFFAPYFKDINLYSHPPNKDTIKRRENGELDLYLTNPRVLNETEKESLVNAVREDAIEKRLSRLVDAEKEVLDKLRKAGITQLEKIELRKQLRQYISEETEIKQLPDSVLFKNPGEEYDWMKVAAKAFNRTVSATSCRLAWLNSLHPSINRGKWTRQEDQALKQLVDMPDDDGLIRPRKDWDKIATLLGTNRTPFLCFHRFQLKHNKICDNRKWTSEEDIRLRELVRQCKINRFVPWTKISYYMHNRTKDQCYQRYVYSIRDDVRQGFFEEVEDHVILIGVKLFGNDWSRIAHFIPTRTPMQIHSRFNTFLKANFENWTQEEDNKLLKIVREKGAKDWKTIATDFSNRTRSQCRQRFYYIYKFYKNVSNFSLTQLPYKEDDTKQKTRQEELFNSLNERVDTFLKTHKISDETLSDDEDEDANIDAMFTVETVRSKNYHTTPDGEKIPMKALIEFMKQLKDDLPRSNVEQRSIKHNVGLLSAQTLDDQGNLVSSMSKPSIPTNKSQAATNKKMQKLFLPAWPFRFRPKEVYRKEAELKTAQRLGRTILSMLNAKEVFSSGEGCGRPLIQSLRKAHECKEFPIEERQLQFLQIVRASVEHDGLAPDETIPIPEPPKKPVVKTYSRKSKQTPYFKPTTSTQEVAKPIQKSNSNFLKFMPPSVNSLVGMRGLLLTARRLREICNKTTNMSSEGTLQKNLEDAVYFAYPRTTMSTESQDDHISPQEADNRLRDRFLSMFYWPAVMARINPDERKDVFDIVEEDEVVAACHPLDASDIIEEAKMKASTNPKIVRAPKKRKAETPRRVHFEDDLSENETVETVKSVAPPPIKKRLLASTVAIASTSKE